LAVAHRNSKFSDIHRALLEIRYPVGALRGEGWHMPGGQKTTNEQSQNGPRRVGLLQRVLTALGQRSLTEAEERDRSELIVEIQGLHEDVKQMIDRIGGDSSGWLDNRHSMTDDHDQYGKPK
jgi:hypothetical protein